MSEQTADVRRATPGSDEDARAADETEGDEGLRFDDPYWDDAFCAWQDPALRTCCG